MSPEAACSCPCFRFPLPLTCPATVCSAAWDDAADELFEMGALTSELFGVGAATSGVGAATSGAGATSRLHGGNGNCFLRGGRSGDCGKRCGGSSLGSGTSSPIPTFCALSAFATAEATSAEAASSAASSFFVCVFCFRCVCLRFLCFRYVCFSVVYIILYNFYEVASSRRLAICICANVTPARAFAARAAAESNEACGASLSESDMEDVGSND